MNADCLPAASAACWVCLTHPVTESHADWSAFYGMSDPVLNWVELRADHVRHRLVGIPLLAGRRPRSSRYEPDPCLDL